MHQWGARALIFLVVMIAAVATGGRVHADTVCYKAGTELDFSSTGMQNTRAKLENPVYFGVGGTVAPETLEFSGLAQVTRAALGGASCDIFIAGGFNGSLSTFEGAELVDWVGSDGGFVIGGCDSATNQTCAAFGRSLTQIGNPGVQLFDRLDFNPLTCGGADTVGTFGGVASIIQLLPGDTKLAEFTDGTGNAAATTDDLVSPTFLFTADADMYGSSGAGAIQAGATATTSQAVFVLNVFKFALDALHGRLANPQCPVSYNQTADLELSLGLASPTLSVGATTTATVTVANVSANGVGDIEIDVGLPAGVSVASASGAGLFDIAAQSWRVDNLLAGDSATITLTLSGDAAGRGDVAAQITAANLPDIDSAPNAGFGADDLADGLQDDDEALASLDVVVGGITLSGHVFEDNGAGAGVAHDGTFAADEAGLANRRIEAFDAAGDLIASTTSDGAGGYTLSLPQTAAGSQVTVRAELAGSDWRHISSASPGLGDGDTADGALAWIPAAGANVAGVDFGQVRVPRLETDRVTTVAAGQSVILAHAVDGFTDSDVTLALDDIRAADPSHFTTALFHDTDCDGQLAASEPLFSGAQPLAAGEGVCVLVRVTASAGVPDGAQIGFDVTATGTFTGSARGFASANTDQVSVGAGTSLALTKQVCNASTGVCDPASGAGFSAANQGQPGDRLVYRILFENPGPKPADDVVVFDDVPAYSSLSVRAPDVIAAPSGLSCGLAVPAMPVAGYGGALRWTCTGQMAPGARGIVMFEVVVDK